MFIKSDEWISDNDFSSSNNNNKRNRKEKRKMNNKFIGFGRVAYKGDLTTAVNGKKYLKITLAINRNYDREVADFIDFMFFEKRAETIDKHTKIGDRLLVSGALQVTNYVDKDKVSRKSFTVIAEQVTFIEKLNKKEVEPKDFEVGDEIDLGNLGSDTPF